MKELPTLKEFEELGRLELVEESQPETRGRASSARIRRRTMPEERLQKILSQAGIASRRKAEELIQAGRVSVNGATITELGSKADLERDHIKVDSKLLRAPKRHLISR